MPQGAPLNNQNASKYDPKYIDEVYAYIKKSKDRQRKVIKRFGKNGLETFETKIVVKLPTNEGFSRYAGISVPTLLSWAKKHKSFRKALRALKAEQKDRLINGGLAGTYNPTIAKLLLSSDHNMKERVDNTTNDLPTNNFSDEQLNRIAERVLKGRSDTVGNTPSKESID
jgi:hypothetical protein